MEVTFIDLFSPQSRLGRILEIFFCVEICGDMGISYYICMLRTVRLSRKEVLARVGTRGHMAVFTSKIAISPHKFPHISPHFDLLFEMWGYMWEFMWDHYPAESYCSKHEYLIRNSHIPTYSHIRIL